MPLIPLNIRNPLIISYSFLLISVFNKKLVYTRRLVTIQYYRNQRDSRKKLNGLRAYELKGILSSKLQKLVLVF